MGKENLGMGKGTSIWAGALLFFGLLTGVFGLQDSWAEQASDAAAVSNQFVQAVSQGDSARAFELCSSGLKRGRTAEDFLKSPEIATVFAGMKSWETVQAVEKGSTVTVLLKLTRAEGNEKIRAIGIVLLKVSGGYKVRDFSLTPWVASEARYLRYLSDLYARSDDLDVAEKEIERAYALDPKDVKVSGFLGYIYLEKKIKLDEAQRLIEAAHNQEPNDPEFMDFLGWASHIANKRQESVEWFDKAREAFQKIEGYQSSPEYIRFTSHVDKAKAKGWRPTQT
jgi:tetratricopeptide (TPR) repeat protein